LPDSPTTPDPNISITPTTAEFEKEGGYYAITTSGSSSTWTAAVSDPWIVLNATSGQVGKGCAYTVTASTNVETRTGYVYVSGHVHTVVQAGHGATISKNNVEVECDGGTGTIDITVPGKYGWNARPNVDWLSVTPTRGVGSGSVTYQVAPWHEVSTRSGTLTVGGNTFTVFQYGKRMKLSSYKISRNYEAHVIPVTVDALAITKWSVTPNASWISIVDAGSGQGGDDVSIAIAENPSYKARSGTVTIGTETLKIIQEGRLNNVVLDISPEETTADVYGANGLIAVLATPDLPWTAESQSNWLTVYTKFKTGAGNGNIAYTASPNPTLYDRTGTIKIKPDNASGLATKTHTVTQPAALSSISLTSYEFAAAGENCAVEVTVDDIVEWQVENPVSWLTVVGDTTRVGPATITIQAAENTTVYPRSCTMTIARKTFTVRQLGRGVRVDTDSFVFGTKSSGSSFTVSPDGNVSWRPVASDDSWIIILDDEERTGSSEVQFVLTQYNGTGEARTGTITVGDKVVYITQRAFDLSINPTGAWVTGNAGAGEIGVSAPIGAVWEAIVTAPWIKVISGYDSGTGSGTVRYTYEDNDTGKTRSGKIVISGTAYVLEQAARVMVNVKATAGHGGAVEGGGTYSLGTAVTLRAVPSDGYGFAYWEGDVSSMQNPIEVTADVAKSVKAVFMPLTPEFISVSNSTEGVTLVWSNMAWATEYNLYRAPSQSKSGEPLATVVADGTHEYFDASGEVGVPYWYWVEAVGAADTNECVNAVSGKKLKPIVISNISYTNLRGTTHTNPATYQEETTLAFLPPNGTVTGYTFAGWTPNGITEETAGDVVATANWTANTYSVVFHGNGGSGTMATQAFTYDTAQALTVCSFVRSGCEFAGWSAREGASGTDFTDGAIVSNLTATAGGVTELWAVWKDGEGEIVRTPPKWTGVAKGDTMALYAVVKDAVSGVHIETAGSLLAAFDPNGECRGVVEIEEGPFGKLFQLSVGIESASEQGLSLKVWNSRTGEISPIHQTFGANAEKQLGAIDNPIVYEIGALTQTVSLNEGWSWVSFALTMADAKVGTLLGGLKFANGDMLKASDKIVSYYNGVWYPSTYALKPGAAYMVKKSAGGPEAVSVAGSLMDDGLTLTAGWNWFGPSLLTTQTIASVTHTGGFVNSDQVKSSSKMATWYGGKWYSADFALCPGCGYLAKLSNAGTLYFGDAPKLATIPKMMMAAPKMALAAANDAKPNWSPVIKGDSMAVYAVVHDLYADADITADGAMLAAFDKNGECRGVTEIEEGPFGKIFQLPIGLESATETGFTLKLWAPDTQSVLEIIEHVDANADKQIGQIFEPTVYTTRTASDPIPDLGENPTAEEISNVFEKAKAADAKLAENVTNETEYAAFRAWSGIVKPAGGGETPAGAAGVMAAPNAWVSFALGSETLLEAAPTDEDLTVEAFEPKSGEDGKFDFTVSVKDVEVGGAAQSDAQKERVKENLKAVFGLEGTTSLDDGAKPFSSGNVDITFGVPEDGKVKFTAGPKDAGAKTFFMKVRVK